MWKNNVQPGRPQLTIKCGACAVYVRWLIFILIILIKTLTAFPQQQWLRERAEILRYKYALSLSLSLSLVINFIFISVSRFFRREKKSLISYPTVF
jgi:hypothetical protein